MFVGTRKLVLIGLFSLLLIVLVNLVWWFNYKRTEKMLENQLSRRLYALVQTASTTVSPLDLQLLIHGELETYLNVADKLEAIRRTDSLSEIFILNDSYEYLATTSLESDSIYFLKDLNGPYIDSIFFSTRPSAVVTPSYRTGKLLLKSAFAPLFSDHRVVVAVLGIEADVDYFDALSELRTNLYYASGLSLLGGIILGVIFLWLQSRMNAAEQKLFLAETHTHLGRMVAVVAHELKNPLMIIRGSAERMVKKTEMPEAEYVIEEVDRLNEIVSGYLDFARAGGSVLATESPEEFDLVQLAKGVQVHINERYADQPPTWIGTELPGTVRITGYRRSLRQVLLNLLINGVEACRESGRPQEIGLQLTATTDRAQIKVIDRGPGFNRKQIKRIFTPFQTTKKQGSGLGLYLSRKIIMEMHGTLGIESEPGQGTTVTVEIPLTVDS